VVDHIPVRVCNNLGHFHGTEGGFDGVVEGGRGERGDGVADGLHALLQQRLEISPTFFACEQEGDELLNPSCCGRGAEERSGVGPSGVWPDFLCLGKGITGGYLPLAATLTTERVYEAFLGDYVEWKQFTHGHSYTGNPLACAAALASLDIFQNDNVLAGLTSKIAMVQRRLQSLVAMDHVGAIRQCGLLVGIELVKDKASGTPYAFEETIGLRVCRRARELGLITRPLGNVITFVPPLCSTEPELTEMLEIIERAIDIETTQSNHAEQIRS